MKKYLLGAVALLAFTSFAEARCSVSGGDILGPFYRPDAAFSATSTIKLAKEGEAGTRITIQGKIVGPDCKKPVAGVEVDVWQAGADGLYDIKTPDQNIPKDKYNLRGQARTDAKGEFTLSTVVPGKYKIPPGLENFEKFEGYLRPAHIHIKAIHPLYLPLTTQLYFVGDKQIAKDPWAQHSRVLVSMKDDKGAFTIVLANTPPK
jgi:protocatechuate 3,4-dioxygenase beta subunit